MVEQKGSGKFMMDADRKIKERDYWLEKLAGHEGKCIFPYDRGPKGDIENGTKDSRCMETVTFQWGDPLFSQLSMVSNNSDLRLVIILMTGIIGLLDRYTGSKDVMIGLPILKQEEEKTFINTVLVLRNIIEGDISFKQLLMQVGQSMAEANKNVNYPVETLLYNLDIPFVPGDDFPLFDTAVLLENIHEKSYLDHIHVNLVFCFKRMAESVELCLEYNTARYDRGTVERIGAHLQSYLHDGLAQLDDPLSGIDILTKDEKEQLLTGFNDNKREYAQERSIPGMWLDRVGENPGGIAAVGLLEDKGIIENNTYESMTFGQLNEQADRLAGLLMSKGVGRGSMVGMMVDRSLSIATAILGILKAGGIYVPVSADYPDKRISYILADSGASVLVTREMYGEKCNHITFNGDVLFMEDVPGDTAGSGAIKQIEPGAGTDAAYVIYTSGSTGTPKGVLIEHGHVLNLVCGLDQAVYSRYPGHLKIALVAPVIFDASVQQIFASFLLGHCLFIVQETTRVDGNALLDFYKAHDIDVTDGTPAHLQMMQAVDDFDFRGLSLKHLIIGGEALPKKTAHGFLSRFKAPAPVLTNIYGPAECCVDAISFDVNPATLSTYATIPIGKPMANRLIHIIGKEGHLQPVGVPGEICISGDGVGRGYLNRPELTAQKFFHLSPISLGIQGEPPGDTCVLGTPRAGALGDLPEASNSYSTGDLGRWLPDGNIEFLGRIDNQVKIRGFRIEPGEIENRLAAHPEVKDAVVVVKERSGDDRYLCAYVISGSGDQLDTLALRDYLDGLFPDYMVPPYIVQLDRFPLTANGKVDRKALPEPQEGGGAAYEAPRNSVEKTLAVLWADVLGLTSSDPERGPVGIDDDFFQLGGHSLKITILLGRIHKELNVRIPLPVVFETSTIRGMAEYIGGAIKEEFMEVSPVEKKEYYPLSPAQKRLYIVHQMSMDNNTGYNVYDTVPLSGCPNGDHIESVFQQLIDRHESLRTSFHLMDEVPVQRIHPVGDVVFSLSRCEMDVKDRWQDIMELLIQPFDLTQAPLLRAVIIRLPNRDHVLFYDMHHIITDGTSQQVLEEDFAVLFEAGTLPPLRIQYKDYAVWTNHPRREEAVKAQESYWLNAFSEELPVLNLPWDFHRPLVQSFTGNRVSFLLTGEETAILDRVAVESGTTMFMTLLAVYSLLLSKLSGQEDIIVGTPVAGRRHADLERLIGMFINTLPLRNFPSHDKTIAALLGEIKQETAKAFENQEYPFEMLVDQLSLRRDTGRHPIFDVSFNLLNQVDFTAEEQGVNDDNRDNNNENNGGKNAGNSDLVLEENMETLHQSCTAKFDLLLTAVEAGEKLIMTFEYSKALFKPQTIERFIAYFRNIVRQLGPDSGAMDTRLSDIGIMGEAEREQILVHFNDTGEPYPNDKTLVHLFESVVNGLPGNTAVSAVNTKGGMSSMSYGDLNAKSSGLARHLNRMGATPGDLVGLLTVRSLEMIIGILGILKAGCVYVPLNPNAPAARNGFMLNQCGATILVTTEDCHGNGEKISDWDGYVCFVETIDAASDVGSDPQLLEPVTPDSIAYVIFTSGSTGQPKGVPISHRNLSPLLHWGYRHLGLDGNDRSLQNLSYYFDWSVWEIFITLTTGGRLYMVPDDILLNTVDCAQFIVENNITVLHATPTQYSHLTGMGQKFTTLKYLFLGAEKLTLDLVKRSFQSVGSYCRLFNMYGPTEATIISAVQEINLDKLHEYENLTSIPIGIPTGNTHLYILDKANNPCPIYIAGELYISGDGVANGYLNRPEQTSQVFFNQIGNLQPGNTGLQSHLSNRFYRTGDLARWLADGTVEFLGRADQQVKIRGFRIEPGEIEYLLLKNKVLREAMVIVRTNEDGEAYLCAYVVFAEKGRWGETHGKPALDELRRYLSEELPDYMVPSHFVVLDQLPVTARGKVDKRALPEPEIAASADYEAPAGELEEKLAAIWLEVLNIDPSKLGARSNFFQVGGHSLKATVMTAKIHREFDVVIPLAEFFRVPTIRGLARYIRGADILRYSAIEPVEDKEYYVLSSAQKRLFVLQRMDPGSTNYNMPLVMPFSLEFDKKRLETAFYRLIRRHESLRTVFFMKGTHPVQRVLNDVEFTVEYYDVSGETETGFGIEGMTVSEILGGFVRPFDLSRAPLLRVGVIRLRGNLFILMTDMHHIISDGVSVKVLQDEFYRFYTGDIMATLPLQYRDYAEWQNRLRYSELLRRQEDFWLKQFKGEIPVLRIPVDFPRPKIRRFSGGGVVKVLTTEESVQINDLAESFSGSPFMVLLAVTYVLFSRLTGIEDIIIGTAAAGRGHADLQKVIGMFVNTLPLRNYPASTKTFMEFLEEVKENTLAVFDNQDYQFDDLVDRLGATAEQGRNPLFDVMFSYIDMDSPDGSTANAADIAKALDMDDGDSGMEFSDKFDLVVGVTEMAGRYRVEFRYCRDLLKEETANRYTGYFHEVLTAVLGNNDIELGDIKITHKFKEKKVKKRNVSFNI